MGTLELIGLIGLMCPNEMKLQIPAVEMNLMISMVQRMLQMGWKMLGPKTDFLAARVGVLYQPMMIVLHCQEMRMIGDSVVEEVGDCFQQYLGLDADVRTSLVLYEM